MTGDHQLTRFIEERPEFIEKVIEQTISRFVEELIDRRRVEFEAAVDRSLNEHLNNIATREFLDIFLISERARDSVKPLEDAARDAARDSIAAAMQHQWNELRELRTGLEELRDVIEDGGNMGNRHPEGSS